MVAEKFNDRENQLERKNKKTSVDGRAGRRRVWEWIFINIQFKTNISVYLINQYIKFLYVSSRLKQVLGNHKTDSNKKIIEDLYEGYDAAGFTPLRKIKPVNIHMCSTII